MIIPSAPYCTLRTSISRPSCWWNDKSVSCLNSACRSNSSRASAAAAPPAAGGRAAAALDEDVTAPALADAESRTVAGRAAVRDRVPEAQPIARRAAAESKRRGCTSNREGIRELARPAADPQGGDR